MTDQNIYFLLKKNQLLMHLSDQTKNIRLGLLGR